METFEKDSPQSSIFSSIELLENFKKNLDLYSINKGSELKSLVYLLKEKKNIISDPLIYSGMLFSPQKKQKNCRYLAEKFKLTEVFIEEILKKYSNIDLNLHYNFEDIRPFLWFNYNLSNKPKYIVDVRYTALIEIENKTINEIFENFDDVKQRDIKKCDKNVDISFDNKTNIELLKKFYEKTMKKNKGEFSKNNLIKMVNFMKQADNNDKGFQTNVYFKNKPVYSIFFSLHQKTACFLYAGETNHKDRLSGTYCLWKAIEYCQKKINSIDLEGINSPLRGSFKITFGGSLKNYYNLRIKNH